MYQKAAIISMMSEEEVKKTGEDIVELFRSVSLIKELTMSSLNKMGLREIYHGNIQCRLRCGKKVRRILKSDLAFLHASTFLESEHISS